MCKKVRDEGGMGTDHVWYSKAVWEESRGGEEEPVSQAASARPLTSRAVGCNYTVENEASTGEADSQPALLLLLDNFRGGGDANELNTLL